MLHFELVLFQNIFLEVCFHFLGALGKLMICFVSYGGFVNNEVFLKYFIENIMHGLMWFYCHDENKFISEMKEKSKWIFNSFLPQKGYIHKPCIA